MVGKVICPHCQGKLKKTKNDLVCPSCKSRFSFREGILIFSLPSGKNPDLEFTKKYVRALEKKGEKFLEKEQEFFERERGKSFAARLVDKKAFATLKQIAGEDFSGFEVLDIGAGGGKEAEKLFEEKVKKVVCLDISFEFLKIARQRLKGKKAEFVVADGENLPFANKSFDLAIFFGSLHHIPNWQKALKQACRVAKRVALVGEPAQMGIFGKILNFFGWNTEYGGIKTHRFSPKEVEKILEGEKMAVVWKTNFIWFPFALLTGLKNNKKFLKFYFSFLKFLDRFFGFWGHNLTVFARDV